MADDRMTDEPDWPLRAVILLAVGAVAALLIQQLIEPDDWKRYIGRIPAWHMAVATGIGVGGLAFGFGLGRVRIVWTVVFAVALGVVAGLIVWWNGQPDGPWNWSGASLFLSVAIAVPLFQVARDEGRASFPYTQVHGHAWTNVVLWGACWGFTGIVLLLSHLLAELFALIGIDFIRELLRKNWSNSVIIGASFGAALALLRDRDRVVRLLQRVVTSVLGFLAPILGVALVLFIVSLPFTGLNNLWEATRSTTPTLMACVIGALILTNAVIGHGPEDEATNPVLRWSALALGVSVLPLAVIAAIAMGLRLNQYGMTPDRLWGLTVVVFAVGYGLVYLIDVARRRLDWAPLIRRDNIRLAFATMAAGLLLATPLLGFNAISAGDQVARLTSGKVTIQKFDWAALAFDFGDPGRRALEALTRSGNASIATRAREVAKADGRWDVAGTETLEDGANALAKRVRILPRSAPLPVGLLQSFQTSPGDTGTAVLWYEPGATSAILVSTNCERCAPQVSLARRDTKNEWHMDRDFADFGGSRTREENKALADLLATQGFQVRSVQRRQVYIGNEPVGDPFE